MYNTKKLKGCNNFRLIDQQATSAHNSPNVESCKDCVYFSSRNCMMDVADSIEPSIDMFQ